jgi:hypothetical protein
LFLLKAYTLADIAAVAGAHVTTSLVTAWANTGVIVPDIEGRRGRGRHRQFSFRNLLEARVVAELHILGLPSDVLRMATAALRLFPLKLSEVYKPTLARKRDDPFGVWMRLLSPEQRKDTDQAVLLCSPSIPGAFQAQVSWGSTDFHLKTKERDPLGPAWIVINLRRVILQVEEATGDNYYTAMVFEDAVAAGKILTEGKRTRPGKPLTRIR